jgi:hypothetical protein
VTLCDTYKQDEEQAHCGCHVDFAGIGERPNSPRRGERFTPFEFPGAGQAFLEPRSFLLPGLPRKYADAAFRGAHPGSPDALR